MPSLKQAICQRESGAPCGARAPRWSGASGV